MLYYRNYKTRTNKYHLKAKDSVVVGPRGRIKTICGLKIRWVDAMMSSDGIINPNFFCKKCLLLRDR